MDMNWQAMLHEAAKASFEKDIEVRAAADNDAYSCVDLPKAKIQELSEKILRLPHQGIALLFSRYCFRLSPQETEKLFQIKNAKGRFRFYRDLLSSSMLRNEVGQQPEHRCIDQREQPANEPEADAGILQPQ